MGIVRRFYFNLFVLIIMFVVFYFIYPDIIRSVYEIGITLLGPSVLLLLFITAVLPGRKRR